MSLELGHCEGTGRTGHLQQLHLKLRPTVVSVLEIWHADAQDQNVLLEHYSILYDYPCVGPGTQ